MPILRRKVLASALAALILPMTLRAHAQSIEAPNFIAISPTLATSGQPTEQALATLGAQGFQAVIYLAPSTVPNAIKEEPELLAKQGIEFIQIPIPFGAPDESHFEALSAALIRLQERKVLVHCEINMRASTLVFLHRVIRLKEAPATAYDAVAQVWSPRGPWRRLIVEQLAKNNIPFEPY
jgi:protein tyrosine phosphatase (PTP) superfamily phosphohydrolase (DUF442 family)